MKASTSFALAIILSLLGSGVGVGGDGRENDVSGGSDAMKIRIVFNQQEVVVAMFDNIASRDFMSLLPLNVEFNDYAGFEKIADLPRKLDIKGSPTPREASGDFTYYAPWGNLAVFYQGLGRDGQLYVLGRIETGKESLAGMNKNFTAKIEKIE